MRGKRFGSQSAIQMRPERIRAILEEYLSKIPDHIEDKVWKYMKLLELWGRRMQLTSVRGEEEVVRFHFGESIFALSLMGERRDGRLADVGSGAGFPGLALKMADPQLPILLIEPNRKKSAFLHEVIRSLSMNGAEVTSTGFGSAKIEQWSLSFITCRALGRHQAILEWGKKKLKPGGFVLLWVGREDSKEIATDEGWAWDEPVLIPRTEGRFILKGRPMV